MGTVNKVVYTMKDTVALFSLPAGTSVTFVKRRDGTTVCLVANPNCEPYYLMWEFLTEHNSPNTEIDIG